VKAQTAQGKPLTDDDLASGMKDGSKVVVLLADPSPVTSTAQRLKKGIKA
jgi:hypothetical protein